MIHSTMHVQAEGPLDGTPKQSVYHNSWLKPRQSNEQTNATGEDEVGGEVRERSMFQLIVFNRFPQRGKATRKLRVPDRVPTTSMPQPSLSWTHHK